MNCENGEPERVSNRVETGQEAETAISSES